MKFKSKEQQAAVMSKYPHKSSGSSERSGDQRYSGFEGRTMKYNGKSYIVGRRSVRGIVKRGDKYLLVQRADSHSFPGMWEFPGGKMESDVKDRSKMNAAMKRDLRREIQEETGLKVRNLKFRRRIADDVTQARNYYFMTTSKDGKARVNDDENQKVGWFTEKEIKSLALTPATKQVFAEMAYHHDVDQDKYIFGDFDRDKVSNIDDPRPFDPKVRKHPDIAKNPKHFHKSNYSDNESKLSSSLRAVKRENERHRKAMEKIEETHPSDKKRIKSVASTIKKMQRKSELTDRAGMTIYAKDYKDVKKKAAEIKGKYKTLKSEEDNHYRNSWKGENNGTYFAHHMIAEVDGKPVEIQIKTRKQAKLQEKSHRLYKAGSMTPKQREYFRKKARRLAIEEGFEP